MKKVIFMIFLTTSIVSAAFAEELQVRQFDIGFINPQTIESVVKGVQSPKGKVTYDQRTNSLIVIDTPENLAYIAKIIEELDKELKMVQIEVTIVDATEQLRRDIGLDSVYVVLPRARFGGIVNLLEARGNSQIRSKSMVTTLSNQPATIQVSQDQVIGHTHVIHYPSGSEVVEPLIEPVGNFLEVVPVVHRDNTISVSIRPSFSTLDRTTGLPFQRSLSTQVVIHDGDTIALGGVESQTTATSTRSTFFGIPLSKTTTSKKPDIIMFLTAKVIN